MYQIRRLLDTTQRLKDQKLITEEEYKNLRKIHEEATKRYINKKYKK